MTGKAVHDVEIPSVRGLALLLAVVPPILLTLLLGLGQPAWRMERVRPSGAGAAGMVTGQSDELAPMAIHTTMSTTHYVYLPLNARSEPGLAGHVTHRRLTLPHRLANSTSSWCTWGSCLIGPRLYHEPLLDGRTVVGWTDSSGNGHVSVVLEDTIETTFDFGGKELRGLAAHDDARFAVLLWDPATETMTLSRRGPDGGQLWSSNLNSAYARFDSWLGGSRLAYGDGLYAAYFTVYGVSGWPQGHYGDQLSYVNDSGVIQPGGWDWGCSHSMAQLVGYHPDLAKFAPVCSSDCYPDKGIMANHTNEIYLSDGNCGGLVSAQLGQIAAADSAWKLVFSAQSMACCEGRGIGLATIEADYGGSYTWLTSSDGAHERDPVLGRLGMSSGSDRYLTGWATTNDGAYWLSMIDGAGGFLRGPEDVTPAGIRWGNRDDSFRTRADGTVSWVHGEPLSSELMLFQFDGASYLP